MPEIPGTRGKILDVAEALFAKRGYAGVGLQEVAVASGLRKSSLFHHFRSKSQLHLEVLGGVLARIEERLGPIVSSDGPPGERLDRWADSLVDVLAEHPTTARLLLRSLVEDDIFPVDETPEGLVAERTLERILGGIHGLLREGVATGAFRKVSVSDTVQTLIGAAVYHFASGDFGDSILGVPIFSAEAVRRRKVELKNLLHHGLAADAAVR